MPSFARRIPRQSRARATVDAILDAAAHILTANGFAALNTNKVAELAGASIGSVYQYFPDKQALVAALAKRHLDEIEHVIGNAADAGTSTSLAELVASVVQASVRIHLLDPALHAALSDHVPNQGNADWRSAFERRARSRIRALLEAHRKEIAITDLDLAAYVIHRSVESCVHGAYERQRADMLSGALAAEVSRLVLSYLTHRPTGPKQRRQNRH